MANPRIGLLPLYVELYDRVLPGERPRMEEFYATIASEFAKRGVDVVTSPVCRLRPEFEAAVRFFEESGAEAVVTLHLAYSPSLESAPVLANSRLPVIVLDTTPTYGYGPCQDPAELMYNHGIHGVQDFCNLLIREGKRFEIEAGHWEKSDVLDRVVAWAKAAHLGARLRSARVGLIGDPFVGMADFNVPEGVLEETIGIETVHADFKALRSLLPDSDAPEVELEMESDTERFGGEAIDLDVHRATTRACLAVRRWMEQEGLTAFTMNFEDVNRSTGMPTVPFLEASKAMARGHGYAGEGDVLTAGFVGALASVYPETSFAEMFCPDWEGGSIFLSHMAELNIDLVDGKYVLMPKQMPWIDAATPLVAVGRFRGGEAVFADLAPGPDNTFTLILAPVTVLGIDGEDRMQDAVRGWMRPQMPVPDFLQDYSRLGGTHHAALVYGDVTEDLVRFGMIMGWEVAVLE